jgi:hypothetical protein
LTDENIPTLLERLKKADERKDENTVTDPSNFYAFSKDLFRIDAGLVIQRPPIFLRMR